MSKSELRKAQSPALTVVVPVLNEIQGLPQFCTRLATQITEEQCRVDVIFVDGGSVDGSEAMIMNYGFSCLSSERGRAKQMNLGAAAAKSPILLFLHADSLLPSLGFKALLEGVKKHQWGRFDVSISGDATIFFVIAWFMNWRSRLTGIATGDQGIFVRRDVFEELRGFPEQDLMEDIALSTKLRKRSAPACLRLKIITSGRRWQRRGICKTVILMWRLRLLYWLGVSADKLAKRYD
ncbi:Uncharacterised protein [Zhongshania aliphaticivorans]|uniref:Glycosyltransferase 2-like domain-containing protein n=1 Tax=Zhongshania aliphaticivorans TaxID=1470434 RepID=A0A5S9Q6R0_9GAMM|nr:TIGR04283 family arsenosugar biosynthesis glycosyltransferase [Zhongshania aliphaticivorans]CAA0094909.1 Uncharacterised protein [Zhongshania aliphaticivorans]CAA0112747.1 Uncharacterised protein [Zhongshania aliphaticivorans]